MRLFPLIVFWILSHGLQSQGVTIGSTNPPDPTAVLDLQSINQGLLLPRLSTAQRNAIQNPAEGLHIYNTTNKCVEVWFPSGWKATGCDCSTAPPAPGQIQGPALVCPGDTLATFSVAPVQGAVQYQWVIDNQDTLVGANGGDSIQVNFSNLQGTRNISVTAGNSCGISPSSSFSVQVASPIATFTMSPNSPVINNPAQFNATTPNANFAWTFQNGTPASSVSSSPSVTWTQTGQVQVQLIATSPAGCKDTLDSLIQVVNCQPNTWQFTTCGATGRLGPSQSQCNSSYGPGVVTVNGGIQAWSVPATGTYRITAAGAQGGQGAGRPGGLGAIMQGDFSLNAGDVLRILVGQQAPNRGGSGSNSSGAGSGGSFVVLQSGNVPLIVAGGGGGAGGSQDGLPGTSGLNGTSSGGGSGQGGINGGGGGAGTGGSAGTQSQPGGNGSSCSYGAGGGGFYTRGGYHCSGSFQCAGESFLNGGVGGPADTQNGGVEGGFGGGAGVGHRASAGGGWSGGGGDGQSSGGGGGGSFNSGTNPSNSSGANSGQGYVTITRICP